MLATLLFTAAIALVQRAPAGVPAVDLDSARNAFLATHPPTATAFSALVNSASRESTKRKLPSFMDDPDNTYAPANCAFRVEVYGPLLERPELREFLRSLVRKPAAGGFDFSVPTAAIVLADAPDEDDFAALFDGYQATAPDNRASIARQLGRAIAARRILDPRPSAVDAALARLSVDATEGKVGPRGAALEALDRSGDSDRVMAILRPLLAAADGGPAADRIEVVTLLNACARVFQRREGDPFLRARAVAMVHAEFERMVGSAAEVTPTQVLSGEGRVARGAVTFLQQVGGAHEWPLLASCLDSPRAQKLLGMDGLQNLRFSLQTLRGKVTPEQGAIVDGAYYEILASAGSRLFALEEEPMESDEKRAFWDARDLRYNALSYFCDQFQRTAAVKERLGKQLDLPTYLAAIFRAKEDVVEPETGCFTAVVDKLENRVLALQLLALIQREWNRDPAGLDLFGEACSILCGEIRAPSAAIEQSLAFRNANSLDAVLEIAVGKAPDDPYVQNAAAQVIANLGHVVNTGPSRVRIEIDREHPWPWKSVNPDKARANGSG